MDIRQYISATELTYIFRVKTVIPLDDEEMLKIERVVMKYMPVEMTAPKKTLFQSNPLDFPTVTNAEVYMFDIELGLPASPYVLQNEIREALAVPAKYVVVRADNDPTENETQLLAAKNDMDEKAAADGLEHGALLNVDDYAEAPEVDHTQYYGDTYNSRFVGYLAKIAKERLEAMKVDPKNPLFKWIDMPKNDVPEDANPLLAAQKGDNAVTAPTGNLDDDNKEFRRVYKGKNGAPKVLTRKSDAMRKDK